MESNEVLNLYRFYRHLICIIKNSALKDEGNGPKYYCASLSDAWSNGFLDLRCIANETIVRDCFSDAEYSPLQMTIAGLKEIRPTLFGL